MNAFMQGEMADFFSSMGHTLCSYRGGIKILVAKSLVLKGNRAPPTDFPTLPHL